MSWKGLISLLFVLLRRVGAAAQNIPDAEHHGIPLHCSAAETAAWGRA